MKCSGGLDLQKALGEEQMPYVSNTKSRTVSASIPAMAMWLLFLGYCSTAMVERLHGIEKSEGNISAFGMFGSGEMFQTNAWLEADLFLADTGTEEKMYYEYPLGTISLHTGFLNWVDYQTISPPHMLLWQHPRYQVDVHPEETEFRVLYIDPFGVLPSTGYPRVDYRLKGTQNFSSLVLNFVRLEDGGRLYVAEVALTTGTYEYRYVVRHPVRPEFSLALSSFVVTRVPERVIVNEHMGIDDNQTVSTARVVLSWSALDPLDADGNRLRYRLHFGTSTAGLSVIYEGYNTFFELTSLDYGKNYFWQVEAVNIHGASSRSPVYRFRTISKVLKAFNYPNPFDPSTQNTNIVFHMASHGRAELSVYTELGDLVWQKTFDNRPQGANEILYDGRDNAGRMLYGGPYVVVVDKIYPDRQERDKCRMLIIR